MHGTSPDSQNRQPGCLQQLLASLDEVADGGHARVSLGDIVKALGNRSFGPLLLLAGLVTLSPVGDIPGTPTLMAALVALTAGQMLVGRDHLWIPRWLLRRSILARRARKALGWLQRPAAFLDRHLHSRIHPLVNRHGRRIIALTCLLVAAAMPPLEFIPFSATLAGLALATFGLALVADDGLAALLALTFSLAALGVLIWQLV